MHWSAGIPSALFGLSIALANVFQEVPQSHNPIAPNDEEVAAHLIGEVPPIRVDFSKFTALESIGTIQVQLHVSEKGTVTTAELLGYDENEFDGLTRPQREMMKTLAEEAQKTAVSLRFRPFEEGGRAVMAQFDLEIPVRALEESAGKRVPFPEIHDFNSIRISLSRTGCFGACPSYRIEVHGDGTVVYEGGMYVAITGQHRATVSSDAVLEMVEAFRKTDYFSLKDKYVWGATDLPTYTTSLRVDGKTKAIVDYAGLRVGMPESLSKLEDTIDRLSGAERWTKGNAETVPALLEERFDFRSPEASEILTNVTERGTAEAVRDLIAAGVVVSSKPILGRGRFADQSTPFGNAAFRGDVEMLHALLGAGFNDGKTLTDALERAASAGKLETMRLLIQYGANPTWPAVLIGAASSGVPDVVREVLKHRPDVNARGQNNTTALVAALKTNHHKEVGVDVKEVIRILLGAGADPNLANDKGETPLMLNARDLEIAETLVAHGGNVNAPAKDGFTPLLNAETLELTRFLLQHGADPFAKTEQGETALDWAKKMNRTDQAALLEAAMEGRKQ